MNATRRRPPISATTLSETDEERPSWDDPAPSFRRSKQVPTQVQLSVGRRCVAQKLEIHVAVKEVN